MPTSVMLRHPAVVFVVLLIILDGLSFIIPAESEPSQNFDPIALDGSTIGNCSGPSISSCSKTLTTTLKGDVILLWASPHTGSPTVSSVTDTAGLTWTARSQAGSPPASWIIYYAISGGKLTSDSIKVTFTAAVSTTYVMAVWGVSGANTVSPFDTTSAQFNSGTGTTATATITTTNAKDFVYAIGRNSQQNTMTVCCSYNLIGSDTSDGWNEVDYKILSASGTQTVTYSISASSNWRESLDAIKQATPSIIQSKACTFTGSSGTCAFTSNTVSGDTSVVIAGDIVSTAVSTVTDTQGLTYSLIVAKDVGTVGDIEAWQACNLLTAAADTITVTYSVSVTATIILYELSPGCAASSSTGSGSAVSSANVASYTPSNPTLVIGALDSSCQVACTVTGGSGYTRDNNINTGAANTVDTETTYNLGIAETTPFTFSVASSYNEISVAFSVSQSITVTPSLSFSLSAAFKQAVAKSFSPSLTFSPAFSPKLILSKAFSTSLSFVSMFNQALNLHSFIPTLTFSSAFNQGLSLNSFLAIITFSPVFNQANGVVVIVRSLDLATLVLGGIVVGFMLMGLMVARRRRR